MEIDTALIQRHISEFELYLQKPHTSKQSAVVRWRPPNENVMKINVDGSYMEKSGIGGRGFIGRDHKGMSVGSGAGIIDHCDCVMMAELTGVLQALAFARDAGWNRVLIETDAVNVKLALQSQSYDLESFGILIKEIKGLMAGAFQWCQVVSQPVSCNSIADKDS